MYTIFHECAFPREVLMSASCSTSADLCFLSRAKKVRSVHERVSHACVHSLVTALALQRLVSEACNLMQDPAAHDTDLHHQRRRRRCVTLTKSLRCNSSVQSVPPTPPLTWSWHFRQWLLYIDKGPGRPGKGKRVEHQCNCWYHTSVQKTLSRIHLSVFICHVGGCRPGGGVGVPRDGESVALPALVSDAVVMAGWYRCSGVDKWKDPDWVCLQCGNMVGQEETRIIRRGGNHREKDGGEGQSLVTTPSKAIDVELPLTLNSLAYETWETPPPPPPPPPWVEVLVLNYVL